MLMVSRQYKQYASIYDFSGKKKQTIFDYSIVLSSEFDARFTCYFVLISKNKSTLYFIRAYQNKLFLLQKLKNKQDFQKSILFFVDMFGLKNYIIDMGKLK